MDRKFNVDATPQKRLFLSIIADYDLRTAICELVDNALDHWLDNGQELPLKIEIILNPDRQLISVRDNAGGVPRDQIQLLVAPGATRERMVEGLIGNFGVGGKRAGIALGERVEIRTRYGRNDSYELELSDKWLKSDDWGVDVFPCEDLEEGSTTVRISELRQGFSTSDIDELRTHLSQTYAKFQSNNCRIHLNGSEILVTKFDSWTYPPDFPPIQGEVAFSPNSHDSVKIRITGGLISDRDPKEENYGVYFYCNQRLVLAHEKSYHVGFLQGYAGVPHPDASLCRVIVEMTGLPSLMPWNSSKSGINWTHPVFLEIRERIFATATRFSTISRRLRNDRDKDVFQYTDGVIEKFDFEAAKTGKEIVSLPVPRGRKKNYAERIVDDNEKLFVKKPWLRGLVEAVGIADIVFKRKSNSKNRVALIILDSTLEIALKEFLVHQNSEYFSDSDIAKLFKSRNEVLKKVESLAPNLPKSDLDLARHYANLRNKLIHERATVDVPDSDIDAYRGVVERLLTFLFDVAL